VHGGYSLKLGTLTGHGCKRLGPIDMRHGRTIGSFAGTAALALLLASGGPLSGGHPESHHAPRHEVALSQPTAAHAAASVHEAHDMAAPGSPGRHHHDAHECTCRGACAATAPRAAPAAEAIFVCPDRVDRCAETPWATPSLPTSLKAYLLPLPNAPPSRA